MMLDGQHTVLGCHGGWRSGYKNSVPCWPLSTGQVEINFPLCIVPPHSSMAETKPEGLHLKKYEALVLAIQARIYTKVLS